MNTTSTTLYTSTIRIRYSVSLYARLEAETGQATGWINKGSLSIATSEDRLVHIRRQEALAHLFGARARSIAVDEARERWPLMNAEDVIGAVWSPTTGGSARPISAPPWPLVRRRCWASITRSRIRDASGRRAGGSGPRRSTMCGGRRTRTSARSSASSGRSVSARRRSPRSPSASPRGSTRWAAKCGRLTSAPPCSVLPCLPTRTAPTVTEKFRQFHPLI